MLEFLCADFCDCDETKVNGAPFHDCDYCRARNALRATDF
jgi:hypothetical protein